MDEVQESWRNVLDRAVTGRPVSLNEMLSEIKEISTGIDDEIEFINKMGYYDLDKDDLKWVDEEPDLITCICYISSYAQIIRDLINEYIQSQGNSI